MKIIYTPNPLDIIIELDERDAELFKLKIRIHQLEEDLGSAAVYLDPKNASWVMKPSPRRPEGLTAETLIQEVLKDYLNMDYLYSEGEYKDKGLDARVDELFNHYVEELKSNHVGDCTCIPASCSKCHAEQLLGIDALKPYPGKQVLYHIQQAFDYRDGEEWKTRSYEEALALLSGPAKEYLLNYHNTHFPKGD